MKRTGRIVANIAALTGSKFLGDLVQLVMLAIISRAYGQEGLGQYAIAMAVAGFLTICASFGLTHLTITVLNQRPADFHEEFARSLLARAVFVLLATTLLFVLFAVFGGRYGFGLIILLVGGSQILFAIGQGFVTAFMAREQMHVGAILELLLRIGVTAGVGVAVAFGASFSTSLTILPIGNAAFAIAAAALACAQFGIPRFNYSLAAIRTTFRATAPYGWWELLSHLSSRIDILVVGSILGSAAAGVYNAGYRIVFALNFVPALTAKALLPVLAEKGQEKQEIGASILSRSLGAALLIAIPAFVGLWLIAPKLIDLVFGSDFGQSSGVLRLLAIILVANTCIHFFAFYLMATGRQPLTTKMQLRTLAICAIANVALVPLLGFMGAALATVLSQIAFMALLLAVIIKELDLRHLLSRLAIGCMGSLTMTVVYWNLREVSLFLLIPVSAGVYFLCVVMFRSVRTTEIQEVRRMLA